MVSSVHPGYRSSIMVLTALVVLFLLLPDLNLRLFHFLNAYGTPENGVFWANITNLGDGLLATGIGIAIFSRIPRSMASMFLSVIIVGLLVQLGKALFNHLPGFEVFELRPVGRLGLDAVNVIGPKLEHYSFPSGHSAAAATMAAIVCLKVRSRTWRALVVLVCTLVALSRAVVGAHWPVDIAAGAVLGVAGALLSVWLVDHVFPEPDYRARIGLYLFAIVVSLALYQNHTRFDDFPGINLVEYTVASVALVLCVFRLIETTYRRFRLSRKVKDLTRNEMVISFVKFGMVGASGFVVDITMFTLFQSVVGFVPELARGIAYWIAATWNWFFNRAFTFADAEKDAHGLQWSKYLLMCLVSFVPNWGTFTILTRSSEFFEHNSQLALIAGVGAGMVFNFVGARFVIFKGDKSEDAL